MSRSSRGSCVAITPSSQGPAGIREWGACDHSQKSLASSRNLLSCALPPGERLNSFSLVEEKLALQNATFKELGVYTILLDVFDGELLFPLLGDLFKAEPKSEDVLSCNMSAATAIKQRPHPQETASNLPYLLPQVPLSQSSRTRSLRLSRSPLGTPPMGCSLARRTRCNTCLPPETPRSLCRPTGPRGGPGLQKQSSRGCNSNQAEGRWQEIIRLEPIRKHLGP